MQITEILRIEWLSLEILVEHIAITRFTGVNFEPGENYELTFAIPFPKGFHHLIPDIPETGEAFFVKINDVLDSLVRIRHVRPVGMARD